MQVEMLVSTVCAYYEVYLICWRPLCWAKGPMKASTNQGDLKWCFMLLQIWLILSAADTLKDLTDVYEPYLSKEVWSEV